MNPDTQFSKERIEMLCDGIFAIAMTLLVLDLKVPELPKPVSYAQIWHALAEHRMGFFAYFLSFMLAGTFWMQHHVLFHYLSHATRQIALLNLVFLMFVSLLPFSTSVFATYGSHGGVFYYGNQLVLALLLAVHWFYAKHAGLVRQVDDVKQPRFAAMLLGFPTLFGLLFAASMFDSESAAMATFPGFLALLAFRQLVEKRARARLAR